MRQDQLTLSLVEGSLGNGTKLVILLNLYTDRMPELFLEAGRLVAESREMWDSGQ